MPDQHRPQGPHAPAAQQQSEPFRDAVVASRLEALAAQVLKQSPAAALPCNLTDEWLNRISSDLEGALGEDAPQEIDANLLAAPLALVVHILAGQHGGAGHAWSFEDLFSRLQDYRVEVALELLNRRTGVRSTPATLTTIFRQREVTSELAYLPGQAVK
jgi:hypothetical protein